MTIHDELAEARDLLEMLTSRSLVLQGGGRKDATHYEIGVLNARSRFTKRFLREAATGRPT